MELILENYEAFLMENKSLINSEPTKVIENSSIFSNYIEALTESLDIETKNVIKKVAAREREMLLEEAEMLSSDAGKAWAIMYFPLLVDMYSTPVLAKILTPFTTNNPRVPIPRKRIEATITNLDGSTTVVEIPSTSGVRVNKINVTLPPGASNILTTANITADATINGRFFAITTVNLQETYTDSTGATVTNDIAVDTIIRCDFTGKFEGVVSGVDNAGISFNYYINGSVDFETGDIKIAGFVADYEGSSTITLSSVVVSTRVNVKDGSVGKVKVSVKVDDDRKVFVDIDSEFVIESTAEEVQDLKAIYNIDLLADTMAAIKTQIVLNKDADIAELLSLYSADMKNTYGAYASVDFSALPAGLTPAKVEDIFSIIVPKIIKVKNKISSNAHVEPQYLLCSKDTATILESLQSIAVNGMKDGSMKSGPVAANIAFTKFNIVPSDSVEDNKIFVVFKSNTKQNAALVDLIYKPLYVEESKDNGVSKKYIRSRTAVEMVDIKKVGYVEIANLPTII